MLSLKSKPYFKFGNVDTLSPKSNGQVNQVAVSIKKKDKPENISKWYSKFLSGIRYIAAPSLFSGEFARLLGSTASKPYPKIRIFSPSYTEDGLQFPPPYIASKEISGFAVVTPNIIDRFASNISDYKGFGIAVTLAYILGEADAKLNNFALASNYFYKVDFDCSLPTIYGEAFVGEKLCTTLANLEKTCSEDIESLPLLSSKGFKPYNWLEMIVANGLPSEACQEESKKISENLKIISNNSDFRREVNRTLLKFVLLPKELLYSFFNSYLVKPLPIDCCNKQAIECLITNCKQTGITNGAAEMTLMILNGFKFLDQRQDEIRAAALGATSFVEYLHSELITSDLDDIKKELLSMQTMNKKFLVADYNRENIAQQIGENYNDLRGIAQIPILSKLLAIDTACLSVEKQRGKSSCTLFFANSYREECIAVHILIKNYQALVKRPELARNFFSEGQLRILQQGKFGKVCAEFLPQSDEKGRTYSHY